MGIEFDHVSLGQRILFGTGHARDNTIAAVEGLKASRIVLIADDFAAQLAEELAQALPVVERIHDIAQHVPVENALEAIRRSTESRADAVICIGGGSATGLAKIVARDTGLPIIAVPTTFAGSEATNVWGVTEQERKQTGIDDRVLPRVVVYDASLMATMPHTLAMSSALNAAAHAIDGFWAPRTDPINRALGTEGLRGLVPGLRMLHSDPHSLEAREQTIYGAYLAAVAFASAGSGMHHKICHALGGTYNLPHAQTHSVVIGYVTAFNAPYAPDASDRIMSAFGGHSNPGRAIYDLRKEITAPVSLAELGFHREDIPEAATIILPTIPPSNPRSVTHADLVELLTAAWAGESID